MNEFKIGDKTIGLGQPIFIAAEVGTTCNGDAKTAKKLIDAAKRAGMDAVKFQIIDPEDMIADKSITYTYKRYSGEVVTEKLYDMFQRYVMTPKQWAEIAAYAKKRGIIMFATPDSDAGIALMESLNMPAYKVSTWDCNFYPFLRKIARIGKPVIIDLGASELDEISRVVNAFKKEKNEDLILLHCFHTQRFEEMNLRTIEYLRDTLGYFSGFSAPDTNNALDYATLAYEPVYIEKRLTLDRKDPNHHHLHALEPDEMKAYVRTIRELERSLGSHANVPTSADRKMRQQYFRSIVAKRAIKKGETLTQKNIACRRPFIGGVDPMYLDAFIGRKATKDLKENQQITWDCV